MSAILAQFGGWHGPCIHACGFLLIAYTGGGHIPSLNMPFEEKIINDISYLQR